MSLKGNAIVAQSGGPTAVINASACGAIQAALASGDVTGVYGATNGILGVLQEDLFDIGAEKAETIEAMKWTPSAAIGSCRYKIKTEADLARIVEVFKAHDIRYFFYAGGNDSMDTADKVAKLAGSQDFEMRVIGIPKTIDNDLACTDHTPGYASVSKFLATQAMEAGRDTEALYTHDTATVMETMGRNAGWIAAATGVAHREPEDAPHLVYVPEVPVTFEKIAADCKEVLGRIGRIFVVAAEGLTDPDGEYLTSRKGAFAQDAFGHKQLGGIAELLSGVIEEKVGVKCRYIKHATAQRNAAHFASLVDRDEAYACGARAVELALAGESGWMVTMERKSSSPYEMELSKALLSDVANGESKLPREYVNEAGNHITDAMRDYVTPLMRGEVEVPIGDDGLPKFMRFERAHLETKCAPWEPPK